MHEPNLGGRTRVRELFLRGLGAITAIAFLSLYPQVDVLIGSRGLLPAAEWLGAVERAVPSASERWTQLPTVFWWGADDAVLRGLALVGAGAGLLLLLGLLPALALLLAWALYLSYATVARTFLSFQWDNLLLECLLLALFVAPWRLRLRGAPAPGLLARLPLLWLAIRLHVESGASKLLAGDPTWRDLSAMVSYYETAPLPTPLAWWAHQMPLWAHRASALATFVLELGGPLCLLGPRLVRRLGVLLLVGMHASIAATANYGFFNLLSALLCLWLLRDGDLGSTARAAVRAVAAETEGRRRAGRRAMLAVPVAAALVFGTAPFLPWLAMWRDGGETFAAADRALAPATRVLAPFRSFNAYHLFASMTGFRDEIVLEGSDDEERWLPYEFHHKAGAPSRAPPVVAPHQPRVDFQLWFLLLPAQTRLVPGAMYFAERLGSPRNAWFSALLERLLEDPSSLAELFATNPFPEHPPAALRLSAWRYRFTDRPTRDRTGEWWERELLHQTIVR